MTAGISAMRRLARISAVIAGSMTLINALLICFEIAMRKFGHPTSWAIDFTVYLTIWAVYLGIAYVESENAQIRMAILHDHLNPRLRRGIELLSSLIAAAFLVVLIWYSAKQAFHSFTVDRTTMTMLRVPVVYLEAAVPIGGVLILLQVVAGAIERLGSDVATSNSSVGVS